MVCSNCNTPNLRDHKYCRECGRPLQRVASPSDVTRMDGPATTGGGHPQDAQIQALLEQAFLAFEAGRLPDARLACQSALALRGESSAAHSLLGLIYEKEGRRQEAIREFEIVLQLNPDSDADRAHLQRLQSGGSKHVAVRPAWLQGGNRPLVAGVVTACVVMMGGLWMAAGALKPQAPKPSRVAPSQVPMPRGAPGAVAPTAGSVQLPPPPVTRLQGTATWPAPPNTRPNLSPPRGGLGGVAPTDGMNARMQALAPRLFNARPSPGSGPPASPSRSRPPQPPPLAPAPVQVPDLAIVPHDPVSRASGVPVLPDARAPQDGAAAGAGPATPPIVPGGAARPPIVPPPAAPEREEPEGSGSYIRIRPLTGDGSEGAANTAPSAAAAMRASASIRPAPSAPPAPAAPATGGPSLAEARFHQQNGLNLWRQRDFAAAYQEYEYAARLYGLIASRGGPEAAAAREGLRAAEQGMRASGGAR